MDADARQQITEVATLRSAWVLPSSSGARTEAGTERRRAMRRAVCEGIWVFARGASSDDEFRGVPTTPFRRAISLRNHGRFRRPLPSVNLASALLAGAIQ